MRVHGCIPPSITVTRVTPETIDRIDAICDAMPSYWAEIPEDFTNRLESDLASLMPETESWSPNARMFGEDSMYDQLSIWRDDDGELERINILFSLSNPNPDKLTRLLALPSLNDCLFLGIQSESVYVPTLDNWLADMCACSAVRYLSGQKHPTPK